eukprot:206443-Amphidinium_carterae.1
MSAISLRLPSGITASDLDDAGEASPQQLDLEIRTKKTRNGIAHKALKGFSFSQKRKFKIFKICLKSQEQCQTMANTKEGNVRF